MNSYLQMNKWIPEIASKLNEQVKNNKMEAIVNKSNSCQIFRFIFNSFTLFIF